jgi:aminopeptidase N
MAVRCKKSSMKNTFLLTLLLLSQAKAFTQQDDRNSNNGATGLAKTILPATRQEAARLSAAAANFKVNFYRCAWQLDPAVRYIRGSVTAYFTIIAATSNITFDLHADLTVDSVRFRNQAVSFQHTSAHALIIQLPATLAVQQKDSVTIFYQGVPANGGLGSFVTSLQSETPVMWSLSEPYGAKDWWPCKNAPSDKADSIDIVITYPGRYRSSSNGLLTEQSVSNGFKTDHWKHRYPIAAYLVAFAITNYVVDNDSVRIGNVTMPVRMYAYPSHADYFKNATGIAKLCLQKFSELFGTYPFIRESYSQTQFGAGGGMEHQTNSFIGSNTNTLVSHELGHQWFGDKVTCNSWQDTWLNEGFATYMQMTYVENFEPANFQAQVEAIRDNITSSPGGSLKVSDTTMIGRIFDNRLTYNKGYYLLRMLRWRLGDTLFFRALRGYLNDPGLAYGTATTADLQKWAEQVSGQSFTGFFRQWYEGEGFPSYQVKWTQNARYVVTVQLSQTTSHPSVLFYEGPVPIRFRGRTGDTTIVFNHSGNNEQFTINPGFAADSAFFDPEARVLSASNTVTRVDGIAVNNNAIKAYYNAGQGSVVFSIRAPTGSRLQLQLLSAAGQLVYKIDVALNGSDLLLQIPAAQLAPGIYFLSVTGDDALRMVKKIMK